MLSKHFYMLSPVVFPVKKILFHLPDKSLLKMSKQKLHSPLLVKYQNSVYDITNFAKKHPGGTNILLDVHNKDITNILHNVQPHSDAAFHLLNEYKLKDETTNFTITDKDDDSLEVCTMYIQMFSF